MGLAREGCDPSLDGLHRFGIVLDGNACEKKNDIACRPLRLELLSRADDVALVSLPRGKDALGAASWIESALKSSNFVSVQRVPGSSTVVTVASSYVYSTTPPHGATVERSWITLKVVQTDLPPVVQLAMLGSTLQAAGVPWRTVSSGDKEVRLLFHRRDLRAGVWALVHAGHAIGSAGRICASRPRVPRDGQQITQESLGAGAWVLVHAEDLAGAAVAEFGDSGKVPLRIQSKGGIYAEVRLPPCRGTAGDAASIAEHASTAGRLGFVSDMGRKVSMRHEIVDFQPPRTACMRQLVRHTGDVMELIGLAPAKHREVWRRVSSENDAVVLRLTKDKNNRAGYWLFSRTQFARIIGRPRGDGLIAGTCCRSLSQMMKLFGAPAIEAELRESYEAIDGDIVALGHLRISRDAWNTERTGHFLYRADDPSVGGVAQLSADGSKMSKVTLRLPDGRQEVWQVIEWSFDPFDTNVHLPEPSQLGSAKKVTKTNVSSHSASSASSQRKVRSQQKKRKKRSSSSDSSKSSKKKLKKRRTGSTRSSSTPDNPRPLRGATIPPPLEPKSVVSVAPTPSSSALGPAQCVDVEAFDRPARQIAMSKLTSGAAAPQVRQARTSVSSLTSKADPPDFLVAALHEFLAQNFPQGVDEAAVQALLSAPVEVQQKILMDKATTYQGLENPSAVLMASLRRASSSVPGFTADGDDAIAKWAAQNQLDHSAHAAVRSLPPALQRKVMDMGPVLGVNSSAIVMGRIRLARMS
jgi:hypothetical protein